ncbi:MAG: hypothetical protein QS748_05995 [Candidatus Endonucleobacter bathymodioli]|uniref:Uncharacterized protein n=1 Tax=Candidatus Endonucleibacter bathymodioli TaxID=539814 RepID=A0AA90NT15_9GAMM|nr:hypothetical protein [Candidatus Endonucleobacter bathymodioli]
MKIFYWKNPTFINFQRSGFFLLFMHFIILHQLTLVENAAAYNNKDDETSIPFKNSAYENKESISNELNQDESKYPCSSSPLTKNGPIKPTPDPRCNFTVTDKDGSEVNKKTQEISICFDSLSSVSHILKNRIQMNTLPLVSLYTDVKQLLFIGTVDKETSNDFYSFPFEYNSQVRGPKIMVVEPEHNNQTSADVSGQGGNNSEHDSGSAIGFNYIIDEDDDSTCSLAISFNPFQLFHILDDTTLDISSVELFRLHPYFKYFDIYITRYGDYDNHDIAIDFQPKKADQHLCNISRLKNEDILIPQSGKNIIISCASVNDKTMTIIVTNKKPLA